MTAPLFPVPPLPRAGQQRAWWRAPGSASALAWAIARAAEAHAGPVLAIARDNQSAHQLESDLHTLLGDSDDAMPVVPFPDWETLPYDQFSPHPEIVSQRLAALNRLPALKRGVVIVPVQTLLQRLPPLRYVAGNTFDVRVGQRLDLDAEKRRLESAGYRNVPQVLDPGDFAVRGGLLDVFPMGAGEPFRVELFDDSIDSIRAFDPESQRSLDKVDAVHLLPGREVPLDDAATTRAMNALRERFDIDTRRSGLFQDLKAGVAPAGVEYYLPLFFDATATLFDYLDSGVLPVLGEGAGEAADQFHVQLGERYEQRRHDIERPLLPPDELYLAPQALRERLNQHDRVEVCGQAHARHADAEPLHAHAAPDLPLAAKDAEPAAALKSFLRSYPGKVLIAADSPGRREALLEVLRAASLEPEVLPDFAGFLHSPFPVPRSRSSLFIAVAPLDNGFALDEPAFAVLTERQLFPER